MNEPAPSPRPGRVRLTILAMIFVNVVINYMDRSNLSIAGTDMAKDLNLDSVHMGYVFSAFGWTYAALQVPGGILAGRFAPRVLYSICLTMWSVVTLLLGFTTQLAVLLGSGFFVLLGLRMAVGAFETPSYPINNRIVTSWFPDKERASAIGTYTAGQFVGLGFLAPVLTIIQAHLHWQGLFFVTGTVGMAWGISWFFLYRDPNAHPRVGAAELDYIEKGGGLIDRKSATAAAAPARKFQWDDLIEVTRHRKLWGIYLGQFAVVSTQWFFLSWFPIYLVKYRHMDFIKSGFLASLPFLAAFLGVLSSGHISDFLVRKGVSAAVARKGPLIMGLLLAMSIIGANYTDNTALVIFFLSLAFFGNGAASIGWYFVSALAPRHLIGLTGGVFNFISQLASIFIPIAIGYIIGNGDVTPETFKPALMLIALISGLGACSYIFLVGKVERIEVAGG